MPRKLPPKSGEKPQFERFIEAAEKIGAGKTDQGLLDVVRKVATARHSALPPQKIAGGSRRRKRA
jgi:hypothetical protein